MRRGDSIVFLRCVIGSANEIQTEHSATVCMWIYFDSVPIWEGPSAEMARQKGI